ncbi:MAG: 2-oxoacid:acceptor oxidoreductase family protein, partial [Spirochaetia bacterium]|nr:2-oxoacid:acceptor oxidoreductase family protein [Spirochaetia bacterium]
MNDLRLNIFLNGVGGQGIGLLSEILMRAYDRAGFYVMGVDTHGLAQRGGGVESHLRVGYTRGNPLVEPGLADLVLSLERTEALRALIRQLRSGGTMAYYDTLWQPLSDRLGETKPVTQDDIKKTARFRKVEILRVLDKNLPDVRMQNIALLGASFHAGLLPGMTMEALEGSLGDLMKDRVLDANLQVLRDT